MAIVKTSVTRNITSALRYCEHEPSVVRGAVNCPPDTELARRLMTADAHIWQQTDGVQGHVIIQSFKGHECVPEQANKIGLKLTQQLAPGYRAIVYTHLEGKGGNYHNHIIIGAVNPQTGKKLDHHNLWVAARAISDKLCQEYGLSIIEDDTRHAAIRYTQTEAALVAKSQQSWKDDLRTAIEVAAHKSHSVKEFAAELKLHGITMTERVRKRDGAVSWTYRHPNGMKARGRTLGDDYTRESVIQALARPKTTALERVLDAERTRQEAERQEHLAKAKAKAARNKNGLARLSASSRGDDDKGMRKNWALLSEAAKEEEQNKSLGRSI